MRLLYFNPWNDLALAANDPHYTPPASALQMATDLQRLPMYWAEEGDVVLVRKEYTQGPIPLLTLRRELGFAPLCGADATFSGISEDPSRPCREGSNYSQDGNSNSLNTHPQIQTTPLPTREGQGGGSSIPLPWGWSPLLVRQLREAGVPDDILPTVEQLEAYRAFASRQTAVRLLERLRATWPEPFRKGLLVGESVWCESEEAVCKAVAAYGNQAMLKAPWSGSGRGVHPVTGSLSEKDLSWIRRTVQRQGGVEVEPYYQKVQDFAMEFWAEQGQVRYEGLSLFSTTDGGVYSGNLVATEEEKERRLGHAVSLELLYQVRDQLLHLLNTSDIPTGYTGPLGIDMMITTALHPLIELNFRMTMGWVALRLARHIGPDQSFLFRIFQKEGRYFAEMTPFSEPLVDNISR